MKDQTEDNFANPEDLKQKLDRKVTKIKRKLRKENHRSAEIESDLEELKKDLDKFCKYSTDVAEKELEYLRVIITCMEKVKRKELDEIADNLDEIKNKLQERVGIKKKAINREREQMIDFLKNESSLPDEARKELLENYGESMEDF